MTLQCTNPDCPEYDVPKSLTIALHPGDVVQCGGCGQPITEVNADVPATQPAEVNE